MSLCRAPNNCHRDELRQVTVPTSQIGLGRIPKTGAAPDDLETLLAGGALTSEQYSKVSCCYAIQRVC